MSGDAAGLLLGGIGLFLLGMMLMTDGLKAAAGPALGRVLSSSTATSWRGLLSGLLVTAVVQSSSAVTVAAIGFVNAGLLSFAQSLWLLFGANVGTTMTGWLVALIGLKIKVEAAALPLVGIGMALRLSGADNRRGAVGSALAGFGVLFLGIALLQEAFAGVGRDVDLTALAGNGVVSIVAFVLAGVLLTVLMQSSSASLALVLTVAESGVLPLPDAAAAVIGANVGTTVTALLATLGATPNAKRAAMAHVLFNVLTGAVALLLLPLLIGAVELFTASFALDPSPAVSLAIFHTVFNVLGVLLMWPLAGRLAAFLLRRFRTADEERGRARYLDRNVASVPSLAIDALRREVARLGGLAGGGAAAYLAELRGEPAAGGQAGRGEAPRRADAAAASVLSRAIADFVTRLSRGSMSATNADALARLLRVQRYYETCGELAPEIAGGHAAIAELPAGELRTAVAELLDYAGDLLLPLDPQSEPFAAVGAQQSEKFEARYQDVKAGLLAAAARGELGMATMEALMRSLSTLRRVLDQATKAARILAQEQTPVAASRLPS